MTSLSNKAILSGADNRPPMLEKNMYDSWKSRIELYMLNRPNGRMILESVEQGMTVPHGNNVFDYTIREKNGVNILKSTDEGPFQIGTVRETLAEGDEGALHLEKPFTTNMFGLQAHQRHAKHQDDHVQNAVEFQVCNNMLPERGRFVTAVKLNKGLRDSNSNQLYAYLKQNEAHANENKMMLDRFTQHTIDPLALMSNVSHQQYFLQSSTTPPSTYVQLHFSETINLIQDFLQQKT
nr:retrovirus-related Pol polyprotein from transposon TNT 1-94 [Tanacetum cinerariifolium]